MNLKQYFQKTSQYIHVAALSVIYENTSKYLLKSLGRSIYDVNSGLPICFKQIFSGFSNFLQVFKSTHFWVYFYY